MARREEGEQQGYLTDEQRSHAGWIGASKCEVILERALYIGRFENYKHTFRFVKGQQKKNRPQQYMSGIS